MDVVANLMIMANSAVAKRIYRFFPGQAILRCHRPPDQTQLKALEAASKELIESSQLQPSPTQVGVYWRTEITSITFVISLPTK